MGHPITYQIITYKEGIPYKLCNRCKKEKILTSFIKRKYTTTGYTSFCKECENIRFKTKLSSYPPDKLKQYKLRARKTAKEWVKNNPERAKEIDRINALKKYYRDKLKPERQIARKIIRKKYRLKNKEKIKEKAKLANYDKKYIDNLTDNYVKKTIISGLEGLLKIVDITPEMVELQRKKLILYRKLKNNE